MKMRKAIVAFLAAICILASICTFGVFAEGTNQVYADMPPSAEQGEYGYCYVYLDDLTDLASLNVAVHYDTEKVTVTDSYNQVACSLYDSSNQNGCLQYSYIFDDEGSNAKTNLFYFCYQVNESAEVGNTYFDIVVTDAYNTAIEPVDISGSRCNFTVTEKTVAKTAYVYGSSNIETSVKEEFEIAYSLSDWQIASGSMVISYDPELFEFVEITNGAFLDGKLADVNTSLDGSVYLSFLATEYNYYRTDLLKIKFRTLKNVTESSEIKLTVSELYDLDLNRIVCNGYTTNVGITHDATYTEDSPSMSLSASYDAQTDKVTVTVVLEKDSHLGAGDFVLNFDTNYLTYSSAQKGFSPSFFNINDKNVDEGILKFSIISLSDITDEQTVLTVVFDVQHACEDMLVDVEISGSGLADSLTNPILLNFVDVNVTVPLEHIDGNDNNHLCDKGCGTIADDGCYDDNTDHACDECGATGMGEHTDGADNNHLCDYGCGQIADDGCHDVNTDTDHKCDECGEDNVTAHVDGTDNDHLCDYGCGLIADDGCYDIDKNHECDECKVAYKSEEHKDVNKDHTCDYGCSVAIGDHTDGTDDNHLCDYCNKSVGEECYDENKDHKCDECSATGMGEHTDGEDNNHLCDYGCGQVADNGCHDVNTDTDHKCDECGADNVTDHIDGNDNNHLCDNGCGEIADDGCYDTNTDHICDECGAAGMGEHTDGNDNNHLCDYGCGKVADEGCHDVNTDADHKCDECGADNVTAHIDGNDNNHLCDNGCGEIADEGCHDVNTDGDHKCDECGTDNITDHIDGNDNNHLCDNGCGEIADDGCYDTNTDHICDECGAAGMGEHTDGNDNNHLCDYGCGKVADEGCHDVNTDADHKCDECGTDNVTVCGDSGKDHICDTDSACVKFSTGANAHADGNDANHSCDYCGGVVEGDVCVDTNPKNHICDECGVVLSNCVEGTTVDGKCDYCGNPVDHNHVDENKDHECDYDDCTANVESHTDTAPKDHKCDSYGDACIADKAAFGEHTDGDDNDHLCDYGCGQVADEGCYGGTATCTAQAICAECGNSYGALGDHAYGELIAATEAVHMQTELKGAVAAHYFCDVCDKYFTETKDETTLEALTGEAPVHTPNADDGDCTTAISCSVCGKITTPANVSHTGGTPTCEKKAECSVCGKEYGEPKGHSYSAEWSKDDTHHWHECSCGDKADETEHSYGEWTVMKEATTTEKGSKTKSCVCGHSVTEEIPATGAQSGNEDEENSGDGNLVTEPDVDNDGLSGGAIAGIVAGSVVVVSFGGFSLFWFVIKKKSWTDLLKVVKK